MKKEIDTDLIKERVFISMKDELQRLNKKINYLEELDRKNLLQVIKLQNKITDYENNFIEYHKYEELQNDYINALQVINNKNKEANNE
tara:strand:+ start:65 stop:328 length:264 start_codon:yes stop_codon:yes gene_type:complete